MTDISRLPAAGQTGSELVSTFTVTLSEDVDAATVNAAAFKLRDAGADDLLDTADDVLRPVQLIETFGGGRQVALQIVDGPLGPGSYRLTIPATITDLAGNPLDGNRDGTAGDDYVRSFKIAIPAGFTFEGTSNNNRQSATPLPLAEDPAGSRYLVGRGIGSIDPAIYQTNTEEDWWSFEGQAGDRISLAVDVPGSTADPEVTFYNAAGGQLISDTNGGPGLGASSAATCLLKPVLTMPVSPSITGPTAPRSATTNCVWTWREGSTWSRTGTTPTTRSIPPTPSR